MLQPRLRQSFYSAFFMSSHSEIIAARASGDVRLDAGVPAKEWDLAGPVRFDTDWQGKNADPALETEVRALWSPDKLYLRFVCHHRELFVFPDGGADGRRDQLWDRDVAEAFLQPPDAVPRTAHAGAEALVREVDPTPPGTAKYYKEFEVAPNGMWIDLEITPSGLADLKSGVTRSVLLDEKRSMWTAELAIPMKSLTKHFDPNSTWRVNFYRVEGSIEPRKYLAWQPTMTAEPNFHVPEKFGRMRFK